MKARDVKPFQVKISRSTTPPIESIGPFGDVEVLLNETRIGVLREDEELRLLRESLGEWLDPAFFVSSRETRALKSEQVLTIALDVCFGKQELLTPVNSYKAWFARLLAPRGDPAFDGCLLVGLRTHTEITLVGLSGPIPPDDQIEAEKVVRVTLSMYEFRRIVIEALREIDSIDTDPPSG